MVCKKCKKNRESFPKGRKICSICTKERKSIWYKNNRNSQIKYSKEYKTSNKDKVKEYQTNYGKKRWAENKELLKEKNSSNWVKNGEKYRLKNKDWYAKNKNIISAKRKVYASKYVEKIKIEVLSFYSKNKLQCDCCGENDWRFLTLDHTENNGAKERRELKKSGFSFYSYLRKNKFPENGYKVLCYNCNCSKKNYNNVCPHKLNHT